MAAPLIGPDGREYEIADTSPENLKKALAAGYRVPSAAAPQTLVEKASALSSNAADSVSAGLLGVAQGATVGGYGTYLGHHGADETPEQAAKRKAVSGEALKAEEEHPVASGVGNLVGAFASPVGEVGKLADGVTGAATLGARVAGKMLGGASVGALYGAGNTLSDASLGNHDVTAEKLISSAGLGALLGGGAGGLFGAVGEGAKAAAPYLGKAAIKAQSLLEDFAASKTLKAAAIAEEDVAHIDPQRAEELAKVIQERGHLGEGAEARTPKQVLESISNDRAAVGKSIDDTYANTKEAPDYQALKSKIGEFRDSLSPIERKAAGPAIQEAESAAYELSLSPRPGAERGVRGAGFNALQKLTQDLEARTGDSENFSAILKKKLANVIGTEVDTQLSSKLGEGAKDFTAARNLHGLLSDAETLSKHGVKALEDEPAFSVGDLVDPKGLVNGIAQKVFKERGVGVVARLSKAIADNPQLASMADSFGQKVGELGQSLGHYAPVLATAAQHGPAEAMATHMVLAQTDPNYQRTVQAAGLAPESPAEQQAALKKAHALATMGAAVAHQDNEIQKGVDAAFKASKTPHASLGAASSTAIDGSRVRRGAAEAHDKHVADIQAMATNPDMFLDRVTANIGNAAHVAPGVAASMTTTANRAVQYLSQAAQQPSKAGPLAPDWKPSEAERFAFAKKMEVVQEPLSVLHAAASGTLTAEQVEALKAVYPRLAESITQKALDKLTESPKAVPYKARLMVGLLTGTDPDGTMGAEAIAANQTAIKSAALRDGAKKEGASADGKASPSRADKLSLAKRTSTPSQARENKE